MHGRIKKLCRRCSLTDNHYGFPIAIVAVCEASILLVCHHILISLLRSLAVAAYMIEILHNIINIECIKSEVHVDKPLDLWYVDFFVNH